MHSSFAPNEWLWILEFNKVVFSHILYPNLCHWAYQMNEIQSYELRNYLILPLCGNEIDWESMETIVKFYYAKNRESYQLKSFLLDLGLLHRTKTAEKRVRQCEEFVFFANNRYFVPLNDSQQRILPFLKRIVSDFGDKKDECKDPIADTIESCLHSQNKKLEILSLRFDNIRNYVENITDSVSLIYRNDNKWIHEPIIDAIELTHSGVFKLPFDAMFFFSILRLPFILHTIERILCVLQFIQSQQLRKRMHANTVRESFLMQLPLLTLSKIVYQQRISVPHPALLKNMGQQILTLLFSTSSALSLLCSDAQGMTLIDLTQQCMKKSTKRFRKTLECNQIMHYFAPSQFRNHYWRPPRFHRSSLDKESPIDSYFAYIGDSHTGQNVNAYIADLLHPISGTERSDQLVFSIMTDLLASFWYFSYAKCDKLNVRQLFFDCAEVIKWMQIDKDLNLQTHQIQKITTDLDECANLLRVSKDYAFFSFYRRQRANTQNTKRSLLKTTNIPKIQSDEKQMEETDAQRIELDESTNIQWSNEELQALNPSLQAIICNFVSRIEYEFEYPAICVAVIDPFGIQRTQTNEDLSFELLYDLGNILLDTLLTISVSTKCFGKRFKNKSKGMNVLRFYKKHLLSAQYLCHKCRLHRLHEFILSNEECADVLSEIIGAFMQSVIGAIYLDSNLQKIEKMNVDKMGGNESGLVLGDVMDFVHRFLPEIVLEEDIAHILHLFDGQQEKQKEALLHRQKLERQRFTNHEHRKQNVMKMHKLRHRNVLMLPTVSEISDHSQQLKTPTIAIRNRMYGKRRNAEEHKL